MRVISGTARGLKLKAPKGLNTRPTTDRIKESLFNIIDPYLDGCDFLDLFSGSGAIGIEALSRNARSAVFVDNDRESIAVIKQNLSAAKFTENAQLLSCSYQAAISKLSAQNKQFDIIFMDPPYNKGFISQALQKTASSDILKKDGFIICEQSQEDEIIELSGFEVFRIKDYKITKMIFIRKR